MPLQKFDVYMRQQELKYMLRLLKFTKGHVRKACELSGIAPVHIYRIMYRNNIALTVDPDNRKKRYVSLEAPCNSDQC